MRGLLINILILAFLLTLYVYVNTDHNKTVVRENSAHTTELEGTAPESISDKEDSDDKADTSYKVQKGDTLSQIGQNFNVSVKRIKEYNGLTNDKLSVGEYIDIPPKINTTNNELADKDDKAPYGDPNDSQTMTQSLNNDNSSYTNDTSSQQMSDRQAEIEKRRKELLQQRQQLRQNSTHTQVPISQQRTQQFNQQNPQTNQQKTVTPGTETKSGKKPEVTISNNEVVNIQSEMDIQDFIQTISEITGQNFILDESVRGKKITVIAPGGFKKENAMKLFQTILSLNGFAVVKKDGTNIIVPKRDIKVTSIPTEVGNQPGVPSDSFITRLVQLKNVQATDVANMLKPLISRDGDIVVDPATNTLIIVETVDNLNRLLKIINNLDKKTEIEFIKLHNADASEVADKLIEIFGGTSSTTSSTPTRGSLAQSRLRRSSRSQRNIPGSERGSETQEVSAQSTVNKSAVGFKVITDERTNSLIVIAYPEDMKKIKTVIEILDTETAEPEEGIYVIRVLNADAEQLVSVLAGLFGGTSGGTGTLSSAAQRTSGAGFGTISGLGSTSQFNTSSTSTTGTTGSTFGSQGIQRSATSGTTAVAETENLRITADTATNSIIFIGSKRDFETVKKVIKQLDVRRRQVYVEAAILEVGLDKIRSFGTNMGFAATINGNTLTFGGTQLPGVPSLLGVAASSQSAANFVQSLSGLFLGVAGSEVTLPGGITIPSYNFLFQALTSLTDVNVLSTPSIMTTDNEPAQIIVADVIPFPTGSTVGTSGVTVQTIQREPVGIRLAITPQISEGDYMNLDILTEVSSIKNTPTAGLNTAQFGIATTTRTADSQVVVKSGETIVIGGLVQDRESTITNRVPVLGNIPVLGALFKFKQKEDQKVNLLILLTPRIVENADDMKKILEEKQKRNMLIQERGYNKAH